jgi:hypothetical protein
MTQSNTRTTSTNMASLELGQVRSTAPEAEPQHIRSSSQSPTLNFDWNPNMGFETPIKDEYSSDLSSEET